MGFREHSAVVLLQAQLRIEYLKKKNLSPRNMPAKSEEHACKVRGLGASYAVGEFILWCL
jgi:hypothetical protein